jgi:hypothetical protein
MFWVNVDKPTGTCTIHKEGCGYVLKNESPLKGIGELKDDGGWVSFPSIDEAKNYCQKEWEAKGYIVRRCRRCFI